MLLLTLRTAAFQQVKFGKLHRSMCCHRHHPWCVVAWGVQQNPCGGKQKHMGLNSCNTQRGQPDFRLIVSLFRFYPYASHEVIQANIPL